MISDCSLIHCWLQIILISHLQYGWSFPGMSSAKAHFCYLNAHKANEVFILQQCWAERCYCLNSGHIRFWIQCFPAILRSTKLKIYLVIMDQIVHFWWLKEGKKAFRIIKNRKRRISEFEEAEGKLYLFCVQKKSYLISWLNYCVPSEHRRSRLSTTL